MSLISQTFDDERFGSEEFKTILEHWLETIKSNPANVIINIQPIDASRFEYDLYGLLRVYKTPVELHWITMRVNGLMSSMDYRADMVTIIVPSPELIEEIYSLWATRKQ